MLKAALLGGHLLIADFIVSNGYPVNNYSTPNPFYESISEVEDGVAEGIVQFMLQKKIDLDFQVHVPQYYHWYRLVTGSGFLFLLLFLLLFLHLTHSLLKSDRH